MFVKKTTLFNHKFVNPARMWGFYLEGVWLWRISGWESTPIHHLVHDYTIL